MLDVAKAESKQGHPLKARSWYDKAVDSEHPHFTPRAMYGLGLLEQELGNLSAARQWYDKAIATKEWEAAPKAMTNLGLLEQCPLG